MASKAGPEVRFPQRVNKSAGISGHKTESSASYSVSKSWIRVNHTGMLQILLHKNMWIGERSAAELRFTSARLLVLACREMHASL